MKHLLKLVAAVLAAWGTTTCFAGVIEPTETSFNVSFQVTSSNPVAGGDFTDEVYDPVHNLVYITDRGNNVVQRLDVSTQNFLAPVPVGNEPLSLGMTSDTQRLLVANGGSTFLTELDSGGSAPIPDPGNETQYSIAVGNAFALYSAGSGALKQLNLETDAITTIDNLGAPSPVESSYDRNFAVVGETSPPVMHAYNLNTGIRLWSHTLPSEPLDVAPDFAATLNAAKFADSVYVSSRPGNETETVPVIGQPAFTWSGKYLLVATTTSTQVFDTGTWARVAELPGASATRKLVVHPNGTQLFLLNENTVGVVEISDLPPTVTPPQPVYEVYAGVQNRISIQTFDLDANTRAVTAFYLPTGAILQQTATGADIVWTPNAILAGQTFTVIVFAAEGNGLANSAPTPIVIKVVLNQADVSVFKTGPGAVKVGEAITYSVTASNAGPAPAPNTIVSDTMPDGVTAQSATVSQGTTTVNPDTVIWNVGTLASGANATMTINATATAAGMKTNVASISSDRTDPNMGNNTDTVDTLVNPLTADVSVTKSANPASPTVGQAFTYSVVAANAGPDAAANTVVVDTLPSGVTASSANATLGSAVISGGTVTWTIGTLNSGASATLTINVTANAAGQITNVATISSSTADNDTTDNRAELQTTVSDVSGEGPDYTATWLYANEYNYTGSNKTYHKLQGRLEMRNVGNKKAGSVKIKVYLSDDLVFGAGDIQVRTLSLRYLNPGRSYRLALVARVPIDVEVEGKYLIAVIDPTNQVREGNENNNTIPSEPIYIQP